MFGTRREFLAASSAVAAAFGLRAVGADTVSTADGGPAVIWLQTQGCTDARSRC